MRDHPFAVKSDDAVRAEFQQCVQFFLLGALQLVEPAQIVLGEAVNLRQLGHVRGRVVGGEVA